MTTPIELPVVVRNKAIAADAEWWIDALAEIVADLERDWSITVGTPFDEGTEAYVAEATTADGAAAVGEREVPPVGRVGPCGLEAVAAHLLDDPLHALGPAFVICNGDVIDLPAGTRLITAGRQRLNDGDQVEVQVIGNGD